MIESDRDLFVLSCAALFAVTVEVIASAFWVICEDNDSFVLSCDSLFAVTVDEISCAVWYRPEIYLYAFPFADALRFATIV